MMTGRMRSGFALVAGVGCLASASQAADLILRTSQTPVLTAQVNLSPGPNGSDTDIDRADTGLLQGGEPDNFTFGEADIERLTSGTQTIGFDVNRLTASGESFSSSPFSSQSTVGTDIQASFPITQSWTIDVVPEPGEVAGEPVRIDIDAAIAGTLNAFGDNLESSASWTIATDHGTVISGSAESLNQGTVGFADDDCLTFTVQNGSSFTISIQMSVAASGDSDGPSQGGDASAFFSLGTVSMSVTSNFTPIGAITPLQQTRTVSGTASASDPNNFVSDSESDAASTFGPFQSASGVNVTLGDAYGQGGASQNSNIRLFELNAQGSSFASGEAFGFSGEEYADGFGSSRYRVQFEIDTEVEYVLDIYMAAFDSGLSSVCLYTDGMTEYIYCDGAFGETNVVQTGVLQPGIYWLDCDADSSAFGDSFSPGYAFAEFDVAMKVGARFCDACVGDLDGNGAVDLTDLATLLSNFGQSGAALADGDTDGDGDVDITDLANLLAAFGQACP